MQENKHPISLEESDHPPTPTRKLTRRERRELGRKIQKPKYRKIAKRIIDQKKKNQNSKS